MIVSKLIFCLERVIWTTRVEIHTPDVPPAILSFILYTLVFLRMRGNIVVDGLFICFRLNKKSSQNGRLFTRSYALRIAGQMLLYMCCTRQCISINRTREYRYPV